MIIVVQGATASGKTGLSIDLAKFFGAEIISADSRQIFKELNIGVARPAAHELSEVKHHFIASHSILDDVTAASFANEAREFIQNYFNRKDVLVLVGGSGLYVDVLLNGIDNLPRDVKLKAEINKQFNEKGISFLKEEILKIDKTDFKKCKFKAMLHIKKQEKDLAIVCLKKCLEIKPQDKFCNNLLKELE